MLDGRKLDLLQLYCANFSKMELWQKTPNDFCGKQKIKIFEFIKLCFLIVQKKSPVTVTN